MLKQVQLNAIKCNRVQLNSTNSEQKVQKWSLIFLSSNLVLLTYCYWDFGSVFISLPFTSTLHFQNSCKQESMFNIARIFKLQWGVLNNIFLMLALPTHLFDHLLWSIFQSGVTHIMLCMDNHVNY